MAGGAANTRETVFDDKGHSVIATVAGSVQGATWGPAADGSDEWFVLIAGERSAQRVAGKDAAVARLRERIESAP